MIKDSVALYRKFEEVCYFCESCGESNHFIINCPKLTFFPQRDLLIEKLLISKDQERKRKRRRANKTKNSLSGLFVISETAKNFCRKNNDAFFPQDGEMELDEQEEETDIPPMTAITRQGSMMNVPPNGGNGNGNRN